jgi:WD40 repeat protein
VLSAAFSPDGARIVTASDDRTARIWDAHSGQTIATLAGHESKVYGAAFSPDGTRIVTASHDHTARIWDARSGKTIATLRHEDRVLSAVFFQDFAQIVTAAYIGGNGQTIAIVQRYGQELSAAFSPDGARILTVSCCDPTVRIWDAKGGQVIATLQGHDDGMRSAAFSPDGDRILSIAFNDRTARIWDARSGQIIGILQGHKDYVLSALFSPDGARIVTTSADCTACIRDTRSGETIACIVLDAAVIALAISGGALALGDALGRLSVLDIGLEPAASPTETSRTVDRTAQ